MTKYIFVTGGVVSGLGKGITAASLGRLLKTRGLKVSAQKFDPYMNVDPGNLSPFQHGEVFVTEDGAEVDLDIGHYERFIDEDMTKYSDLTSGRVYWTVLERERNGMYLGETVQIIPHVTNEIKSTIRAAASVSKADILITEIGGTVGDIESQPFLEAIRQFSNEVGRQNCLFLHVTLIPFVAASGEYKSKPTQHSVKELRSVGIVPDIIVARIDEPMDDDLRKKIAMFCDVRLDCVIENQTVSCLYDAPLMLHREGLDRVVCRKLRLKTQEPDLLAWADMVQRMHSAHTSVRIAIVGKYIRLHDANLSVSEALAHAGFQCGTRIEILWIESSDVTEENAHEIFANVAGILIPGGFGDRGVEGMMHTARFALLNHVPFLSIGLGMQAAVISFARHQAALHKANSREFANQKKELVIDSIADANGVVPEKAQMRLGAFPCKIAQGSRLQAIYQEPLVHERHRHRYEISNQYRDQIEKAGMLFTGTSPDGHIAEAMEIPTEKFYIGVQFHPEFKSRPNRPHPLFVAFIRAAQKPDCEESEASVLSRQMIDEDS